MPRTFQPIDWYSIPRYYDLVFSSLNRQEIAFIDAIYKRYDLGSRRRILEPACGTGRLMEGLARKGYRADGFDLSLPMVEFAQKRLARKGLKTRAWLGDMSDFKTKTRYDLAYCLVSSFKYLLTEEAALRHLRCIAAALRPGGIYMLGFHLSEYEDQRSDREEWHGIRGRTKVKCQIDSQPPQLRKRIENIRVRMTVNTPRRTSAMESKWQFRTYSRQQFLQLIHKVPELQHVATHNFDYHADEEIEFGEEDLDNVVILRRTAESK